MVHFLSFWILARGAERSGRYYDSDDAFNFYFHVWGGECIHVGLYEPNPAADRKVPLAQPATVFSEDAVETIGRVGTQGIEGAALLEV